MEEIKVNARERAHFEFDVLEKGSSIVWKFKSDGHDISFGIFHGEREVLPLKRVDAHKELQTGKLECERPGKYTVVFDNSYSYTKGKHVHHRIEIIDPFSTVTLG